MRLFQSSSLQCSLVLFTLFLVSCSSVGLAPPASLEQRLAYAYGVHTAVMETATVGIANRTLNFPEGRQVLMLADQSRLLLDAAKVIVSTGGDTGTALAKLTLATQVLDQLQLYLKHPLPPTAQVRP